MEQSKLEHFEKRLLGEKQHLEKMSGPEGFLSGASLSESVHELVSYDGNHPGDLGTETFEREKDLGLRNNAIEQLQQVKVALERIDAGSYGFCASCGGIIPEARLEALPSSTECVDCQNGKEQQLH